MCKSDHLPISVPGLTLAVLISALTGMAPVQGQNTLSKLYSAPSKAATHDAVDEKTLQEQVAGVARLDAVLSSKTKPVGPERPSTQSSLLSNSLVLSDGVNFTLIPVGSILNLPVMHRHRVLSKPEGNFTFWPAFLNRNSTWLSAKEVTLKMARGDAKAAQSVLQETTGDNRVVVAVLRGGPISILEPERAAEKHAGNH